MGSAHAKAAVEEDVGHINTYLLNATLLHVIPNSLFAGIRRTLFCSFSKLK